MKVTGYARPHPGPLPQEREKIERPPFVVTPLAEGLAWRGDGTHRFEEKIDGVTHCMEVTGRGYTALLWGELVRGRAGETLNLEPRTLNLERDTFYAVDVLEYNGEDLRKWPRRESLKVLDSILPGEILNLEPRTLNLEFGTPSSTVQRFNGSTVQCSMLRPATGTGGEFLEAVLARGGEGVVASLLDEPFAATRWKCKRVETFIVTVLEKHAGGKSSVRVGMADKTLNLEPRTSNLEMGKSEFEVQRFNSSTVQGSSWIALFGRKFDQVRVGSVLKVEGYGLTDSGKIREPRVCKDTETSWLVRY